MKAETVTVIKQTIDLTAITISLSAFITQWFPPLILIITLMWWGIKAWEKGSGRKIENTRPVKWLFNRKDNIT